MKKSLMIILTISLSSCQNIPILKEPIERCSIFLERLGENTFSGKCRCHLYEITPDNIGRVSESIDHGLEYCDRHVTLKASTSWTELRGWFEELMILYNQNKERIEEATRERR